MNKIKKKIETYMTDKGKRQIFSFGTILFVLSLIYGSIIRLRRIFYEKKILLPKKLPCKTISIGNLTVGGTGKTPMTIHVAHLVEKLGYKTAVISRGYKGKAEKNGGIVSDGRTIFMGPDEAGDEPFMMATKLKKVPVIVGQNRFEMGMLALKEFKPDVIIFDDAFQHLRLTRDIDLVLIDSIDPFGNKHLLPRGILREPFSALLRGDAFILTRSEFMPDSTVSAITFFKKYKYLGRGKPAFKSFHIPYIHNILKGKRVSILETDESSTVFNSDFLKGCRLFAFSGIGNNNDFKRTIEDFKCVVTGFLQFPDHHLYSDEDLGKILHQSIISGANFIATTEKDYVRIAGRVDWPIDLVIIGIKTSFGKENDLFNDFIKTKLQSAGIEEPR